MFCTGSKIISVFRSDQCLTISLEPETLGVFVCVACNGAGVPNKDLVRIIPPDLHENTQLATRLCSGIRI